MSEAGKDANARPDSAPGGWQPASTLARVAPQSVQLAKDHALLGQSIWCGIVFALAVVITVMNILPPAKVGYRVTAQALISPARYQSLERHLHWRTSTASQATTNDASLLQVKLLDDASVKASRQGADEREVQVLIEVSSLWEGRTSSGKVQHWLADISHVDPQSMAKLDSARVERFARWEVETRQNYLNQHRQLVLARRAQAKAAGTSTVATDSSPAAPGSPYADVQLDVPAAQTKTRFATLGNNKPKFSTASTSVNKPEVVAAPASESSAALSIESVEPDEIEKQLAQALLDAQQRQNDVAAEVTSQANKLAGTLTLASAPRVRAVAMRMPGTQILSILVLALACGALGGWANHRAQSGGTYRAVDVGANMALLGLPILGRIDLPDPQAAGLDVQVSRQITTWRRWIVTQCLALSELAVLFWCLAILIRVMLDPLWRAMLWDNPLAALARLFIGLP